MVTGIPPGLATPLFGEARIVTANSTGKRPSDYDRRVDDDSSPGPDAARAVWQARIPNARTCARVLLAAVVIALLASVADPVGHAAVVTALALFIMASLTDALDGYLARRWGVVSAFGRVMDPFADKILVLGTLVVLTGPGFASDGRQLSGLAGWMVALILGRDLLVTSIRGLYESRGVDFSAGLAGKVKMIVQSVATPLILLVLAAFDPAEGTGRAVVLASAWAMVAVTVWSALPYVVRAMRAEKELRS